MGNGCCEMKARVDFMDGVHNELLDIIEMFKEKTICNCSAIKKLMLLHNRIVASKNSRIEHFT